MQFAIPDTQEFIDTSGNSYLGYNIHINGLFHCTVRYKQLLNLHEHLSRDSPQALPPFPPKKLFPLTISQQEERRQSLEKYIQTIGQTPTLTTSPLLNSFLLSAQQETSCKMASLETLDLFLQGPQRISLRVSTNENTSQVLKKLFRHLKLPPGLDHYFALFAIIEGESSANVIRRLEDFESPVLTLANMDFPAVKLMVGRSYWDTENDTKLSEDPVALDILYQQAIAEVRRGWTLVGDLEDHLSGLCLRGNKREYLDVVRSCKYYGFTHFAPCLCDYPQGETKVLVAIGRNELNMRMLLDDGTEHEAVFKVTRMRCWRITTLHNGRDRPDDAMEPVNYALELSFEYLVAKNDLQWITIVSDQAILMSVSLQGMIDELLLKRGLGRGKGVGKSWSYVMRDGHSKIMVGEGEYSQEEQEKDATRRGSQVIKKNVKKREVRKNCDVTENGAFHMIGDDDL